MKYLWTEDTGAGLHFWKLVNQLFFNDALVVESKESNQRMGTIPLTIKMQMEMTSARAVEVSHTRTAQKDH